MSKNLLLLLVSIIISTYVDAQIFSNVTYAGSNANSQYGVKILHLPGNQTAVLGVGGPTGIDFDPGSPMVTWTGINADMFLVKYDSNGNPMWVKGIQFFTSTPSVTVFRYHEPTGHFYILMSPNIANYTWCVMKLDSAGDLIWRKNIQPGGDIGASDMSIDSHENIYLTGFFEGQQNLGNPMNCTSPNTCSFISKWDSSGTFLWSKKNDYQNFYSNGGWDIALFNDTILYTGVYNTDHKFVISRIDSSGNNLWTKLLNVSSSGLLMNLDAECNIYLRGISNSTFDLDPDTGTYFFPVANNTFYIAKYDSSFNFKWGNSLRTDVSTQIFQRNNAFSIDSKKNVYVTGSYLGTMLFNSDSITSNGTDIFISKFDSLGHLNWYKTVGSTGYDTGEDVKVNSNDEVFVTGGFADTVDFDLGTGVNNIISNGGNDYWLGNFPSDSALITNISQTPFDKTVLYPNPTTGKIYGHTNSNHHSFELYDLQGKLLLSQEVFNLSNFEIDLSDLEVGIYLLYDKDNAFISSKKIIVMK